MQGYSNNTSQSLQDKESSNQNQISYKELANYKQVTIPPDNQKIYFVKYEKLGLGSFATTHLATLKEDESKAFACKCIQKDKLVQKIMSSNNPEGKKQFFLKSLSNEVKVWMNLKHPNIVQFCDFSETQNNYYLIMEMCNNGDLEQLKKEAGGRLSERNSIILFKQLADGCKYLYDQGVFHRDLKPANVLIKDGVPKIADFGFCKMLESNKDEKMFQTSVGTPYYMSPQILAGEKYSIKCDVWSLGIIYYEVLCGQYPWSISSNSTPQQLLELIFQFPIKFPVNFNIQIDLQYLIQKMLTIDEENRYSMVEVQQYTSQLYHKYVQQQQKQQQQQQISNQIQQQQQQKLQQSMHSEASTNNNINNNILNQNNLDPTISTTEIDLSQQFQQQQQQYLQQQLQQQQYLQQMQYQQQQYNQQNPQFQNNLEYSQQNSLSGQQYNQQIKQVQDINNNVNQIYLQNSQQNQNQNNINNDQIQIE